MAERLTGGPAGKHVESIDRTIASNIFEQARTDVATMRGRRNRIGLDAFDLKPGKL